MKKLSVFFVFLAVISFVMFFVSRNKQEYKVIFDSNGRTFTETQIVKYHQKVVKPADPTRENFIFNGWKNNGENFDFNKEIEENYLLTASWTENNVYTVTITLEGVGYVSKFYEGNTLNIENYTLPQKEGYSIVLYNNDQLYNLSSPITSDLNLVAKYEKNS